MREAILKEGNKPYRAALRLWTPPDTLALLQFWAPVLERGPTGWADRKWDLGNLVSEVAFEHGLESLVLTDEVEPGCQKDILGILITSGPHQPTQDGLNDAIIDGPLIWLECIAICPSLRGDCPHGDARKIQLKLVAPWLMLAAIERSIALGCDGRIGLHADGEVARQTYRRWEMQEFSEAKHPTGEIYPRFFGNRAWAANFKQRLEGRK